MKSKSLFGVQFAQSTDLKADLLQHYLDWKNEALQKDIINRNITEAALLANPNVIKLDSGRYSIKFDTSQQFLSEISCKHYLITNPVLEMCSKIRVKEPFELQWLQQVADGKRQLNFGDTLIRYEKSGDYIGALAVKNSTLESGNKYMNYSFFNFDLSSKKVSGHFSNDDFDPNNPISYKSFDDFAKKCLYQLIIYMELADITEVLVPPGRSHGNKKNPDKLLNESDFSITIVTTAWNKIIRTTGFDVSGYLRKQPCGPENKQRKLIWIDPYHKNGYNLNARAQLSHPRVQRGIGSIRTMKR